MDTYQAVFLGIVQALTEFLPVSSSGHLVIFQHVFGLREAQLLFDVSVHLGTLGAVAWVFRSDIGAMVTALPRMHRWMREKSAAIAQLPSLLKA